MPAPMSPVNLRRAKRTDIAALRVIETASFSSDILTREALRRAVDAPSQWLWVAVSPEDVPVGYILLHFRTNSQTARLYSLAVLKAWRGQQIASRLLEAAVMAAKTQGCGKMALEARLADKSLIDFYQARGFSPMRILPQFYEDGADAMKMELHLHTPEDQKKAEKAPLRNARTVVVVPREQDLRVLQPSLENRRSVLLLTAQQYLGRHDLVTAGLRVINLCPGDEYLSSGYYVSLVGEARGSVTQPSIDTLSSLKAKRLYAENVADLNRLLPSLADLDGIAGKADAGTALSLEFYFGRTDRDWARRLAKRSYQLFAAPILELMLVRHKDEWRIDYVWPLSISAVDAADRPRFLAAFDDAIGLSPPSFNPGRQAHFDLAILVDPDEALPPSNGRALQLMTRAAKHANLDVEIIQKKDLRRLEAFDALFVRATTNVNHYTYRFALKAEALNMPVIDDAQSILRCSNKVFLAEALTRAGLQTPRTKLVTRASLDQVVAESAYPLVLKIPDGSFSRGVIKVKGPDECLQKAQAMLEESFVVLAQEYLPTDFDWRIGVINGEAFFACKYFMARGHWQIYQHKEGQAVKSGGFAAVPLEDVPFVVLDAAVRASLTIGQGLYGIDLKEIDGNAVVIEVNDNPNLDAGIEDKLHGPALYERVMTIFHRRILASKGIAVPAL